MRFFKVSANSLSYLEKNTRYIGCSIKQGETIHYFPYPKWTKKEILAKLGLGKINYYECSKIKINAKKYSYDIARQIDRIETKLNSIRNSKNPFRKLKAKILMDKARIDLIEVLYIEMRKGSI